MCFSSRKTVRVKARERDEVRGTERLEERKGRARRFQREEPMDAMDLVWVIVVLERERKRSWGWE